MNILLIVSLSVTGLLYWWNQDFFKYYSNLQAYINNPKKWIRVTAFIILFLFMGTLGFILAFEKALDEVLE